MGRQQMKSRPGLFGTVYYYDENGKPIGKSRPGLLEGTRVYTDQKGRYAGKSRPGFLAKEVFTDTEHNHITSYDSLCGEVHFRNGVPVGRTRPGFFGSAYTTLETEDESDIEDLTGCFEDAETEEEDYAQYDPKMYQHMVVRNLRLFALCLAICMVIACIYAIVKFT